MGWNVFDDKCVDVKDFKDLCINSSEVFACWTFCNGEDEARQGAQPQRWWHRRQQQNSTHRAEDQDHDQHPHQLQ